MGWVFRTIAIALGTAVAVSLLARAAARMVRGRPALHSWLVGERWPLTCCAFAIALRANVDDAPIDPSAREFVSNASAILVIGFVVWVALRAVVGLEASLAGLYDVDVRDNRVARARRTQLHVLRRVACAVVIVIGVVVALRSFAWGRELGTSLLAAGGVIGLVLGISGRSTIGNMIAGVQIALSEPIRLDDVVVVEGEWGNIEEITLTNVVVRLWDQRRLVLPTSYFVEQPFQNWTRRNAEVLGTVELWVDYTTDVPALRVFLEKLLRSSPHWDGRVAVLQVTDATAHALLVRALVSAADAPTLWDLRCEVREGLAQLIAQEQRASIPRLRVESDDHAAGSWKRAPMGSGSARTMTRTGRSRRQ